MFVYVPTPKHAHGSGSAENKSRLTTANTAIALLVEGGKTTL